MSAHPANLHRIRQIEAEIAALEADGIEVHPKQDGALAYHQPGEFGTKAYDAGLDAGEVRGGRQSDGFIAWRLAYEAEAQNHKRAA